jgi:hypothetical protein
MNTRGFDAMQRSRLMLLGLAALSISVACGGSDGGSSGGTLPNTACVEFNAAATPESDTVTSRQGLNSSCDMLAVDLIVTDVDDLFTADFTFTFDPTLISYQSVSTNLSILTQDGTPLTTISKELAPGEISIAITRLGGAQGGADAVGEHFMARLFLRRLADSGATSLDFTSARFFNSQVQVIPGVQWRGGSIVIQ